MNTHVYNKKHIIKNLEVLHLQVTFIHEVQGGFYTCIDSISVGSNYE